MRAFNILLLLILNLGVRAGGPKAPAATPITPTPVAGQNTTVTIGSGTFMIAYPAGIPAGADVRFMLSWGGLGETTGADMSAVTWNQFVQFGYVNWTSTADINPPIANPGPWDMRQRKSDGSYIYWIILGIPDIAGTTIGSAIDATVAHFAGLGLFDSSDASRFYSIQLSAGGRNFWEFRTKADGNTSIHRDKFNRSITMSTNSISTAVKLLTDSVTALFPGRHAVFFATNDPNTGTTPGSSKGIYQYINSASAKRLDSITLLRACHCDRTWDSASSYINFDKVPAANVRTANSSLITWMAEPSAGTSNQPPVANAGVDQSIQLPTNTVTLSGSGTDPDGSIAAYEWVKVSGPAATIFSPTSASTTVNNLVEGTYIFQLTVTDNNGATGADQVTIIVTPAAAGTIGVRGRKYLVN